jgi:hypothetical protein
LIASVGPLLVPDHDRLQRPPKPATRQLRHWSGSRTRHASTAWPGPALAGHLKSELVETAERGQIGAREPSSGARRDGSAGHVKVFQMSV